MKQEKLKKERELAKLNTFMIRKEFKDGTSETIGPVNRKELDGLKSDDYLIMVKLAKDINNNEIEWKFIDEL